MKAMPDREPSPQPDREPRHYNREPFPPGTVVKLVRNPYSEKADSRDLIVFVAIGSVGVVYDVKRSVNIVKFQDAKDGEWVTQNAPPWRLDLVAL